MSIDQSYNFRRIDERITTSGVVPREVLEQLREQGIEVVINLLPHDSDYAVPGEADLVTRQGIEYVYIPVDFSAPAVADFQAFSAAMDRAREKKVHLHCAANFRVSAFVGAWSVQQGYWSRQEADAFIADLWNPSEHLAWPEFIDRLTRA